MVPCRQILFSIQIVYNHTYNAELDYIPVRHVALTREAVLPKLMTFHHLVTIPWLHFKFTSPQPPPPPQMAPTVSIPGQTWESGQLRGSTRERCLAEVSKGGLDLIRALGCKGLLRERERGALFFLPSIPWPWQKVGLGSQPLFCHHVQPTKVGKS